VRLETSPNKRRHTENIADLRGFKTPLISILTFLGDKKKFLGRKAIKKPQSGKLGLDEFLTSAETLINERIMLMQIRNNFVTTKEKSKKEDFVRGKCKEIKTAIKIKKLDEGKKLYQHNSTTKNPNYEEGIRTLPFEPCLIHDKSHRFRYKIGQKSENDTPLLRVQTIPKWLTTLLVWRKENNELIMEGVLQTNNFRASNHRKIKALDKFCNKYQPLYEKRKVTMLFLTFTRANYSKPWLTMMHLIKEYFNREGNPILDYIWTAEVSENLHFHYHLCIAINRVSWKKIPKRYMFENLWGQRTEINFVKKNIKYYMSKYFAKSNFRIEGLRSYGISKMS
jgi:hypothetical protein